MINPIRSYSRYIVCFLLSFFTCLMANGRWSVPFLAWIYPILFLYLLHAFHSRKIYLMIFAIYSVVFVIQFADVIGMDLWICTGAALLLAGFKLLPYLYWRLSKKNFLSTITFAASMVMIEYFIYLIYPSLGGLSDAYTQYRSSYLLQIVTITGIYGITFIMYWTAAIVLWTLENKNRLRQLRKYIVTYCTVISLIILYGIYMYQFNERPENSVRIAGVTVPVSDLLNEDEDVYSVFYTDTFTDQNMKNTIKKLSEITDGLFAKTILEAQAGAKIVFWSELNGAVMKEDEAELLQRAANTAKEQGIYLMVSLLVKTPYENLKENKIVTFCPNGTKISEYYKYGRSIGELCIKGDGKLKSFDTEYGRIAPFICSDMAFISAVRQAGKNNVDILVVPSSDWESMTGIATKTAVVRGVENGCNIIRHTNRGTSIVSDSRGNIRAEADYFQSDSKTLAAEVLTGGRFTFYSHAGSVFICVCGLCVAGGVIVAVRKKYLL